MPIDAKTQKAQRAKPAPSDTENTATQAAESDQTALDQNRPEPVDADWRDQMAADFEAVHQAAAVERKTVTHITGLITRYTDRVEDYTAQISSLESDIARLRAEIPKALASLADPEAITKQIHEMERQIGDLRGYIDQLEGEVIPQAKDGLIAANEALRHVLLEARQVARAKWTAVFDKIICQAEDVYREWDVQDEAMCAGYPYEVIRGNPIRTKRNRAVEAAFLY